MGVRAVRIDSVAELVTALCKDYDRRREAIKQRRYSNRVTVELKYLNYNILDAARESAGIDAEIYIREIGSSTGYAKTAIENISETTYKIKKAEVRINIAKRLHLID